MASKGGAGTVAEDEPFPTNVTILQYLLENDAGTAATKSSSTGVGRAKCKTSGRLEKDSEPPITVHECPEPGCGKQYLRLDHLKAHERIHLGEVVCNWETERVQEGVAAGESGLKFLLQNENLELVYEGEEEHSGKEPASVEDAEVTDFEEDEDDEDVDFSFAPDSPDSSKQVVHVFDAQVLGDGFIVLEEDPDEYVQINLNHNQPMRTTSTKARKYFCPWDGCERAYTKSSHVTAHMRVHTGELPFACPWEGCDGRFARAETLSRHYRRHSGKRNYVCPQCDSTFARSDHLRGHMKRHSIDEFVIERVIKAGPQDKHKPTAPTPSAATTAMSSKLSAISIRTASKSKRKRKPSTPASGLPRNYACSFPDCGKTYTRASHLKAHEILHGKALPFHCPWEDCERSFARSFELSRHRRQHTGEKKFVCHICQQAFMRSDHLSAHVKRHTLRAFLDADVFLTNPATLTKLVSLSLPIVAPMLLSDGLYSNFWCGMTPDYYYQRTEEYKEILNYGKTGEFTVPMVHSAVMVNINLLQAKNLAFETKRLPPGQYGGPQDDIIIFAMSANFSGIPMTISNSLLYGYILMPLEQGESVEKDVEQLTNVKVYIVNEYGSLSLKEDLKSYVAEVPKDKLSLSHIYMINLERRPERRLKMVNNFDALGLEVEYFPAVDGKKLNDDVLREIGVEFLPGYTDPYHKRPMTMGEIGCFLSHYYIWERMVELGQEEVLVLEDDIRFEPYFKRRVYQVLDEARRIGGWDLIYFGRKRLQEDDEKWIEGTESLVQAGYSYWTLGYLINLQGAKKLLAEKPLKKLVPVDEYIPIMFNNHPNETWLNQYHNRDLVAWSAAPLLLYPTHYTGDDGYISDTEDSAQIDKIIKLSNETTEADSSVAEKKGDKEQLLSSKVLVESAVNARNEDELDAKNRRIEL